jgi:DNA-directed RNA polymerase omega subunit
MAKRKTKKKKAVKEEVEEQTVEVDPDIDVERQIPLNELPTLFSNSYEIVVAAARRARQLNLGLRPLVKTGMNRPVDVALAELAAKKVEYASDDDPTRDPTAPRRKSKSK